MDSVAKIDPTLWKPDAESRRIFDVLGADSVRFVGGFVRNSFLNLEPGDADMATLHHPEEVTRLLTGAGIKVVPTGIDHGTVTAVVNGIPFEITTLRRDVETDGRHAVVAYSDDWAEDAWRRDFTMNTLLADLDGNVFDPTGSGVADLRAGRVVFVGEPAQRIAEDYLRILRFFRFHALYGRGAPDAAALDACRAASEQIRTLSRERIMQEMMKIIAMDDPVAILELMRANNVMSDLFHSSYQSDSLKMLCVLQAEATAVMVEPRLYIIAGGDEDHRVVFERYFVLSKERGRILDALYLAVATPCGVKERLYRFGRTVALQSILIIAAINDVLPDSETKMLLRQWQIPVLPVSGEDLRAMGIDQGPAMGELLRQVETWWIGADFPSDRLQVIEIVNKFICEKPASKI